MRRQSTLSGLLVDGLLRVVPMLALLLVATSCGPAGDEQEVRPTIVLHGGAGTIRRENMTAENERAHRQALEQALRTGYAVLDRGGSALDAVEATARFLEDSPLFNAGRGAVFSAAGANELDASIMDGATGEAGAVAAVRTVRHPVTAARRVMENTRHVLLVERGADLFAAREGLEIVDPEFFHTDRRWKALLQAQQREGDAERESAREDGDSGNAGDIDSGEVDLDRGETDLDRGEKDVDRDEGGRDTGVEGGPEKHGTIGVLALDRDGDLAAATSTGGLTNKMRGRVGDSPIIGAGTFADNSTCAVSATGVGEYYMRALIAHDVSARMRYTDATLKEAVQGAMQSGLYDRGGTGGLIGLDGASNVAFEFNTPGMYRGYLRAGEEPRVMLYGDE